MPFTQTIKAFLPRAGIDALKAAREVARPLFTRRERLAIAMNYLSPKLTMAKAWSRQDTEISNFNYDITDHSKKNLANMLSVIADVPVCAVYAIFSEVEKDTALSERVSSIYAAKHRNVEVVHIGRRLGWYAAVRLLKPELVVETGVDMGLGSCVLCAALLRNKAEGGEGRYIGTDIVTSAGVLFTSPYNSIGKIVYGDSIETLKTIAQPIDLFINDSDHSSDYEGREYDVIKNKMSPRGIILGDNSHVTTQLADFSQRHDRKFLFFKEEPKGHWYPGAGIGFSFQPK